MTAETQTAAMRVLSALLEARTGQVLAENRMWRMETSLKPVLRANGLVTLEELVGRLLADDKAGTLAEDIVNALLNNESSFFRDNHVFQMLARELLPAIAERRKDRTLRIWSAGCSTGQEAYSLAMAIRNNAEAWKGWRIHIAATDVSTAAVAQARSGTYSSIDVQRGLAINDLLLWFEPAGDDWRINAELRHMIDFRVDNLFDSKLPAGQFDLILCRNVLLYFSAERRRQVFDELARHSHAGSFLLLGAGETVIDQTADFSSSHKFPGIYGRVREGAVETAPQIAQPARGAGRF
ncbi:MAG: protein-glutamate O-methyltransferase CheR [Sphingobium sp.]